MNRKTLLAGLPILGLLLITMGAGRVAEPSITKGPYPMLPTTQSVTICWVSVEETTGGVVHYGDGKTVTESGPKTRYHRVTITGLKPYTRYSYQVTQESQTSEPASFLTTAKPDQAFHFTAYGDCRTQPDKHAAVIQRMAAFHPDFVVQTGDLVADGTKEDQRCSS